jgi:hypothetical protein
MSDILETEVPEVLATPEPAKSYQCRHIHTAGRRCGSASLRGEHFCYYHHTTRTPAPRMIGYASRELIFDLPPLEDRTSVRFAIAQVLSRIACNQLDHKRASLLLYGLQIAAITLPKEPRPTAPSQSDRYSHSGRDDRDNFNHRDDAAESPLIEDLILDPDHGPLAPIAEVAPPKAREKGFAQRLLEEMRARQQAEESTQANTEAEADADANADAEAENPNSEESPTPETIPTIQAVAAQHRVPVACPEPCRRVRRGSIATDVGLLAPSQNSTRRDAILTLGLTVTPVALPRVSGSMRRWRNWQTH